MEPAAENLSDAKSVASVASSDELSAELRELADAVVSSGLREDWSAAG